MNFMVSKLKSTPAHEPWVATKACVHTWSPSTTSFFPSPLPRNLRSAWSRHRAKAPVFRSGNTRTSAGSQPDLGGVMRRSEEFLSRNQVREAIAVVRSAQQQLDSKVQAEGGASLLLQQYLSLLLFTAADYGGAAEEARQAYQQLCRAVGKHEVQSVLLAMRLGIYELASGDVEGGVQRLFESGSLALPLLDEAMQEAQRMGGGGAPQEALQEQDLYIRRLMGHLGESAFYYSLGTARQMAAAGDVEGLLESWDQVEGNMVRGLTDMAAIMGASNPPVANALREHARLVVDFDGVEALGGRLRQQSSNLREVVEGTARWQRA